MTLPISVVKKLELAAVDFLPYLLRDENDTIINPAPPPSQTTVLVLLEDSLGKVQCLLTQDHFIDLTTLCDTLGRNLKGVESPKIVNMAQSLGLEYLPSLPCMTNLDCVMSPEIAQAHTLYFASGIKDHFIQVSGEHITRVVQPARTLPFSRCTSQYTPQQDAQDAQDENDIKQAVQNFTTLRIKKRLDETLEIPPMPGTSRKIVQLRVDPDASINALASVVETDPSLAAQVVSWAASPYYAAPGKIKSVHDAVMRVLGFDLVINIALGLSLGKSLQLPKNNQNTITSYWQQAVFCATTTETICQTIPKSHSIEPGLAYLAGLLNNFGSLLLSHIFPPHAALIDRYAQVNPQTPRSILDHFLIGITREQLASWLFKSWNMPEEIVSAIRWQNNPQFHGPHYQYANMLFIANQRLKENNIGEGPQEVIPKALLLNLNIDDQETINATQKIWENAEHLDSIAQNLSRNFR